MIFLGLTLILPLLMVHGFNGTPTDSLRENIANNGSEYGVSEALPEEIRNQLRRMAGITTEISAGQQVHLTEEQEISPASPATASDVATLTAAYEPLFQRLLQSILDAEIHRRQLQEDLNKSREELTKEKKEREKERRKYEESCHRPQQHPQQPAGIIPVSLEEALEPFKDIQESFVKVVSDLRAEMISCERLQRDPEAQKEPWPVDCYDLFQSGIKKSGAYTIHPKMLNRPEGVRVWCDMGEGEDGNGGWTVIIKRQPLPQQVNFTREGSDYKMGFGDPETEYWIGNDVMHALTTGGRPQKIKIIIEDWDNTTSFAVYNDFSVGDEASKYQLSIEGYANASTASDGFVSHHGMKFSTQEEDNDTNDNENCVQTFRGSFWYLGCYQVNPTNELLPKEESDVDTYGIEWGQIDGTWVNRKAMYFMIHPRD